MLQLKDWVLNPGLQAPFNLPTYHNQKLNYEEFVFFYSVEGVYSDIDLILIHICLQVLAMFC